MAANNKKAKRSQPRRTRSKDSRDRLESTLMCLRWTIMTVVLSLEGKGVYDNVALHLRRNALVPIDEALKEVSRG